MSYKVVVINNKCKLSFKENSLVIDGEKKDYLDNVSTIMINSLEVTITSYLVNELVKRNISLIFCDECKHPSSNLLNLYGTNDMYKKLNDQINYSNYNKAFTWRKIVINKLFMQQQLLYKCFEDNNSLTTYINTVMPNDVSNCEAFAARTYFNKLFGNNFNRRVNNSINSALNYGYTILLSLVNRVIVSLGYNTALGIKHSNKSNDYNFSCDIIEPFRPLVDRIVILNINNPFDVEYKRKLIQVLNCSVKYNDKIYKLDNAVEAYFLDVIKCLSTGFDEIGMIEFYD